LAPNDETDILAFTAASDSTPSKFDTISNFDPTVDRIDLSEIPGIFSVHALGSFSTIPAGNIAAPNSVSWFIDLATKQTIIDVNTTASVQSTLTASMEIVLNGQLVLTNSDFVMSESILHLNVASGGLTLPAGGSVALPISVSAFDLDDTVSVNISGLTPYESVTDQLDNLTFAGGKTGSIVLTAAEANSGLSLNSNYTGSGKPVNLLTITASNSTPGETFTTAPQSITVTDPPISTIQSVGEVAVGNGALLELPAGTSGNVLFAGSAGTLKLDDSQHFNNQISGFSGQDVLDLADLAFSSNMTLGYTANNDNSSGILAINNGVHGASLALLGNYMASAFATASDGHGGTLVDAASTNFTQQSTLTQPHV
jgi:hypothetical protein